MELLKQTGKITKIIVYRTTGRLNKDRVRMLIVHLCYEVLGVQYEKDITDCLRFRTFYVDTRFVVEKLPDIVRGEEIFVRESMGLLKYHPDSSFYDFMESRLKNLWSTEKEIWRLARRQIQIQASA